MFSKKTSCQIISTIIALAFGTLRVLAHETGAGEKPSAAPHEHKPYAYATKGIVDYPNSLKLLLDESNLGGQELELAEVTFAAGSVNREHKHGSVEVFYVLSGSLGHEVNGELHWLSPGMVGVVRPGDTVRHLAPKESDVKVLVIWAPAGEAKRLEIIAPLRCSFSQIATYKGQGNQKDPKNFECK